MPIALPPSIEPDHLGRIHAVGRRKTSSARVWIKPGEGRITINKKSAIEYFHRDSLIEEIISPFDITDTIGKYSVMCIVHGGGERGQAGAIRHGISRCLEKYEPHLRGILKKGVPTPGNHAPAGFLTRDARKVERKKAGRPKARKKDQWVKR